MLDLKAWIDKVTNWIVSIDGQPKYRVVENVSLGSISKNGSAYEKTNCDVSSSIPSGYKLAAALFSGTGSYQVYCYECRRVSDTTVVFRGFLHTGTAPASITPRATLICEKAS